MNELKDVFYSLKNNKSPGCDDICYNVIKKFFDSLCEPLKYLFSLSTERGVFPNDLEIAPTNLTYKDEDSSDISNCTPISVLPCLSKILERIMYNRLYKYLIENNISYSKQLCFSYILEWMHKLKHVIKKISDIFSCLG